MLCSRWKIRRATIDVPNHETRAIEVPQSYGSSSQIAQLDSLAQHRSSTCCEALTQRKSLFPQEEAKVLAYLLTSHRDGEAVFAASHGPIHGVTLKGFAPRFSDQPH
jgi:hypothetical protein